jgi:hypothetical protein
MANVRNGSLADITTRSRHVCFAPESGHSSEQVGCPKSAISRTDFTTRLGQADNEHAWYIRRSREGLCTLANHHALRTERAPRSSGKTRRPSPDPSSSGIPIMYKAPPAYMGWCTTRLGLLASSGSSATRLGHNARRNWRRGTFSVRGFLSQTKLAQSCGFQDHCFILAVLVLLEIGGALH